MERPQPAISIRTKTTIITSAPLSWEASSSGWTQSTSRWDSRSRLNSSRLDSAQLRPGEGSFALRPRVGSHSFQEIQAPPSWLSSLTMAIAQVARNSSFRSGSSVWLEGIQTTQESITPCRRKCAAEPSQFPLPLHPWGAESDDDTNGPKSIHTGAVARRSAS